MNQVQNGGSIVFFLAAEVWGTESCVGRDDRANERFMENAPRAWVRWLIKRPRQSAKISLIQGSDAARMVDRNRLPLPLSALDSLPLLDG